MAEIHSVELTQYFEFIDPYKIRIKGHRIGIEHMLRYYFEGYSPEEIAQEFPGLDLEKIYASITYYLANQQQIDAYLANRLKRDEQAYLYWQENDSPPHKSSARHPEPIGLSRKSCRRKPQVSPYRT